mgnify:CR=1 FL=1
MKYNQKLTRYINKGKIRVEYIKRRFPRLGLGESSAIFLSLMRSKIVVLDDKRARKLARELGLETIGTLSILKKLYETPSAIYRRLVEIGFYIDKKLFDDVFEKRNSGCANNIT